MVVIESRTSPQTNYSRINPVKMRRAHDKLQVLCSRATRRVVTALNGFGPRTVQRIVISTGMPQSQVSSTLARMRRHGYVDFHQYGKHRYYYLIAEEFHRVGDISRALSNDYGVTFFI